MKYAIALIAGITSAAGAAGITALALAILNLYLTGHGITWQNEVYTWHFVSMSFLDSILIAVLAVTFPGVTILVVKLWKREVRNPAE